MKKLVPFLMAIVLMATLGSSVWSQDMTDPMTIYLHGGASVPKSDFGDNYKMAFHGGAAVGLAVLPGLEAMARISYHSFGPEGGAGYKIEGGRFTALLYGVEGKLSLGQYGSGLFVGAGVGFAKIDITESTVDMGDYVRTEDIEMDDEKYFSLAAGIEFDRLFIEARYVKILDEIVLKDLSTDIEQEGTQVFLPLSVGIRF
jgi:hypothetical protein